MVIKPNWPAPPTIKACTTLRSGGVSQAPFDQLNLAQHVGDLHEMVLKNRDLLKQKIQLPSEPIWINQTHSTVAIPALQQNINREADASFTDQPNRVCVVLTADCLPILLCNQSGTHVAAIHAGWRGLLNGVIESTLKALNLPKEQWLAWLGPAISAQNYEVSEEVRAAFISHDSSCQTAFHPSPNQRWLADLYAIARIRLEKMGISAIWGGQYCTFRDSDLFYSYRRDQGKTGRMASLIWITA